MTDRSHRTTVTTAEEKDLQRLLHGELRGPQAQQLRERLSREPALAARYGELEAAWSALGESLPVPPTPDLATAVRARLRESESAPWQTVYGGVLATAIVVVGVGLGWWVQGLWITGGSLSEETPVLMSQAEPATQTPTVPATRASESPAREEEAPSEPSAVPARAPEPVAEAPAAVRSAPRVAATRPLGEDFEAWSATLGGEPEWNDDLFSSSVDELLATAEAPRVVEGWDETLADGWGLPSGSSMAAAYLGLEETAGGD